MFKVKTEHDITWSTMFKVKKNMELNMDNHV